MAPSLDEDDIEILEELIAGGEEEVLECGPNPISRGEWRPLTGYKRGLGTET